MGTFREVEKMMLSMNDLPLGEMDVPPNTPAYCVSLSNGMFQEASPSPIGNNRRDTVTICSCMCMMLTAVCSEQHAQTEQHFTGKERDTESGNDYFEARYYSSAMGRFMSPDWSAKVEPVPYSKLDDPQSLNLYAYVQNNPLIRFDKDGHDFVTKSY